ncbi:MAG: Jag N-terminal domain-containing protein, partial [Thermoplasmata archaeon]|nr:Jag N-terminal domain-containing protein [Thermoplasmata archaeon]
DPVFSGADVAEAVKAAARALGVTEGALRYVVLEAGRSAGLGISASPARIAVLLEGPGSSEAPAANEPRGIEDRVRRVLGAVIETAGLDATVAFVESDDVVRVILRGPDRDFFLSDDAEVFQALEHLVQRMFGHAMAPRRLLLDCEGYRDARDAALREKALGLAASVRADGTPRATEPLNAYERRIIHVTLSETEGITTYSVGEGSDRRVTIAPRSPARE